MLKDKNKTNFFLAIIFGCIVGFLNGFFGGGGGMVVVPILNYIFKKEDKTSHATAILIILPLCVMSAMVYALNTSIDFLQVLNVGVGFLIGGISGALLLKKLSNNIIRLVFSVIMIGVGVRIIFV